MKWLSKWLFKMTKEGSELYARDQAKYPDQPVPEPARSINSYGMHFTLHKANGGFVVEYRSPPTYNNMTNTISIRGGLNKSDDGPTTKLHIITNEQDLGQQLSQIITYEALQQ